jgi:hypothetical protein
MAALSLACAALVSGDANSQSGASRDPTTLIKLWKQENEKCRGGFGDDPRTDAACAARKTYEAKLRAIGWCYEYQGAATIDWHKCLRRDRNPPLTSGQ